jgi:hypothetical protein
MVKPIVPLFVFFFLSQLSLMHLLHSTFLCLHNTPWAPPWSWPFAWSNTVSFFWFFAPSPLHNPVFCVSRILCNPALRISRIFRNLAFCVSNTTGTSFFLLRGVNLANPANLICPSICVAIWADPSNLANPAKPANPIYLPVLLVFWLTRLPRLWLTKFSFLSMTYVATPVTLK